MPFRLSSDADSDLDEMYVHGYQRFGPAAAESYLAGLLDAFDMLAAFPRIGRSAGNRIRVCVCRSHIIIYSVGTNDVIEIGRVLDARSNWREHLG